MVTALLFIHEKMEQMEEIQDSVTEQNCFDKLVEYFQVCREVGKKESLILNADWSSIMGEIMPLFLLNLPYCMLEACDSHVREDCIDDVFLGCEVESQKYIQSFMDETESEPMIFTYRDIPSKESITIYDNGINRTLAYIENEENPEVIDRMRDLVCNQFFRDQRETLEDIRGDEEEIYYEMIETFNNNTMVN